MNNCAALKYALEAYSETESACGDGKFWQYAVISLLHMALLSSPLVLSRRKLKFRCFLLLSLPHCIPPESVACTLLHAELSFSLPRSFSCFLPLSILTTLPFSCVSHTFVYALSLFLPLIQFHLHTPFHLFFLIFFWCLLYWKTFSGPFFFLGILTYTSITRSHSRYRFANERRAFFTYTCCSALRFVSRWSFTPETYPCTCSLFFHSSFPFPSLSFLLLLFLMHVYLPCMESVTKFPFAPESFLILKERTTAL